MTPLRSHAIPCALGALALAASTLVIAAPASAATDSCSVSHATLDWGFKESFRAYIDGSIANGEWTTGDGASYVTPEFGWTQEFGDVDAAGDARLRFRGSVEFTGHDGLLDTTISNPIVSLDRDGSVRVALDVSGVTMEGEQIHDSEVPFLVGTVAADGVKTAGGTQTILITAPELTEQGSTAFPNYEAGTPFDDLTVTVSDPECTFALGQTPATTAWLLTGVGSAVVVALVAALIVALRRRKEEAATGA